MPSNISDILLKQSSIEKTLQKKSRMDKILIEQSEIEKTLLLKNKLH